MQDKAPNNWKQLLDNADSFPDKILKDKNEAWEKLYARLNKKPGRKLLGWYWAAASLMAISITIIIFSINKKQQSPLDITSSPASYRDSAATKKLLVTEQQTKSVLFQSPTKNISLSINQKNTPVKKNEAISSYHLITDSTDGQTIVEKVMEPVLPFDSSAREIATAAPVKKKLRVIHINDIGQPLEKSTADNQFIERDRFRLKILNNETYNPAPAIATQNGLIIFKSRNASN